MKNQYQVQATYRDGHAIVLNAGLTRSQANQKVAQLERNAQRHGLLQDGAIRTQVGTECRLSVEEVK